VRAQDQLFRQLTAEEHLFKEIEITGLLRNTRTSRLAREAEAWFFADDDHWPFAFVNICAVLGLDPAYIRLGLARWHPDPSAQPQKQKKQRAIPRHWPLKTAA